MALLQPENAGLERSALLANLRHANTCFSCDGSALVYMLLGGPHSIGEARELLLELGNLGTRRFVQLAHDLGLVLESTNAIFKLKLLGVQQCLAFAEPFELGLSTLEIALVSCDGKLAVVALVAKPFDGLVDLG